MNTTSGPAAGETSTPPPAGAEPSIHCGHLHPTGKALCLLALGAVGVVYGDIGTSVLYAVRECFHGSEGVPVNRDNILGVLSLVFWALTLIVSVKYIAFILRAANRGEGGVLALMSLAKPEQRAETDRPHALGAAARCLRGGAALR